MSANEMRLMESRHVVPRVLPYGWRVIDTTDDGARYRRGDGLVLILSGATELDGKRWVHLSISRSDRLPSWDELKECKDLFLGRDVLAVQVLPPASKHVNIHPYVLHLWRCLDGDPCPDFTRGGGTI